MSLAGVVTANLDDEELFPGCHEAAGLLKLFLRELPTPLLTFDLYPQLLEIAGRSLNADEHACGALAQPHLSFP
jgi:hypothetical protein